MPVQASSWPTNPVHPTTCLTNLYQPGSLVHQFPCLATKLKLSLAGVQEVSTLRMLRHRNIVQFYGACLEPDCFFIVTELMQGASPCTQAWLLGPASACAGLLTHG